MGQNRQSPEVSRIRRNIENYGDPYIIQASSEEVRVCTECGAIYSGQRWYLKLQADPEKLRSQPVHFTICPACRKIRDRSPGGIVNISGAFVQAHREDILNLIRNEGERAMAVNPLERIMDIDGLNSSVEVLTTNERLAQRIGRALHKAYCGEVTYRWSEDNKLARVSWQRD
ncbi:MAG: ATPase [Armatimonadetes bacterium]|nr:ATPase [Armatimonadota bacterium]